MPLLPPQFSALPMLCATNATEGLSQAILPPPEVDCGCLLLGACQPGGPGRLVQRVLLPWSRLHLRQVVCLGPRVGIFQWPCASFLWHRLSTCVCDRSCLSSSPQTCDAGFLNLFPITDIGGWVTLCCGAVLGIAGCSAASLASTHQMSIAHPSPKNVSGPQQMSPEGLNVLPPRTRTAALTGSWAHEYFLPNCIREQPFLPRPLLNPWCKAWARMGCTCPSNWRTFLLFALLLLLLLFCFFWGGSGWSFMPSLGSTPFPPWGKLSLVSLLSPGGSVGKSATVTLQHPGSLFYPCCRPSLSLCEFVTNSSTVLPTRWHLYVPRPGIEPTNLRYWDYA